MLAFKETLLQCGLEDLGFQGHTFKWRNGRPGDAFMQERLDRACATTPWQVLFPEAQVLHLQVSYSDHDPILLTTQPRQNQKRRHHRFEERWVAHQDCEKVIRETWRIHPQSGSPMFRLFEKIKHCRLKLEA